MCHDIILLEYLFSFLNRGDGIIAPPPHQLKVKPLLSLFFVLTASVSSVDTILSDQRANRSRIDKTNDFDCEFQGKLFSSNSYFFIQTFVSFEKF